MNLGKTGPMKYCVYNPQFHPQLLTLVILFLCTPNQGHIP